MLWAVMPVTGSCQLQPLTGGGGQITTPIAISKPVGQGPLARNLPEDVRIIQEALNRVTVKGEPGGPLPFLNVDGICGPKTNAAIVDFQRIQLGFFDGVIEPGKKTILRLNEIVAPISDEELKQRVKLSLPLVSASITAALANLTAAISQGPATAGPAAVAADRLNRHFRIGTLAPSAQSNARIDLFRTYTRFSAVMGTEQSIEIAPEDEFDFDKKNPKFALTRVKGFFEVDQVDPSTQKRLDRIHLGLAFFGPTVTPDFGAFIILHELAHFISHADGRIIDDHGRGWFDDTFIRPLDANKRLTNADSYAGFAHECRVNSAQKPPFVKTAPGGLGGAR